MFTNFAYEESTNKFCEDIELVKKPNLYQYQKKLAEIFTDSVTEVEEIKRKKILLGLSMNYIQQRYTLESPYFNALKVSRSDFILYIRKMIENIDDSSVQAYLATVVMEHYVGIVNDNPDMGIKQQSILEVIAQNTKIWLCELTSTVEGQFQLLNTVSFDTSEKVKMFKSENISHRLKDLIKCELSIKCCLDYLWKIMCDLCINKENFDINKDYQMFDPKNYINDIKNTYICFKYKQDYVDTSVIIPSVELVPEEKARRNICSRISDEKPRKWYMNGTKRGMYDGPMSIK